MPDTVVKRQCPILGDPLMISVLFAALIYREAADDEKVKDRLFWCFTEVHADFFESARRSLMRQGLLDLSHHEYQVGAEPGFRVSSEIEGSVEVVTRAMIFQLQSGQYYDSAKRAEQIRQVLVESGEYPELAAAPEEAETAETVMLTPANFKLALAVMLLHRTRGEPLPSKDQELADLVGVKVGQLPARLSSLKGDFGAVRTPRHGLWLPTNTPERFELRSVSSAVSAYTILGTKVYPGQTLAQVFSQLTEANN